MNNKDEQFFECEAISCSIPFEVDPAKKEEFLNHQVDSLIKDQNEKTLEKVKSIIIDETELNKKTIKSFDVKFGEKQTLSNQILRDLYKKEALENFCFCDEESIKKLEKKKK